MKTKTTSCPSAPVKIGHSVIGVFDNNDQLIFSESKQVIDKSSLIEIQNSNRRDYRVSMPCLSKNCQNWNGKKCTVPENIAAFIDTQHLTAVANCSIRYSCQWFDQEGYAACKICPKIRTELIENY